MNPTDPPPSHPPAPDREPDSVAAGTGPGAASDLAGRSAAEVDALWMQIYRLQTTLAATLVALIFLSLGIVLFMGKQMTTLRARLAADRQQSRPVFSEFQQNTAPRVRAFVRALQTFATTNQDFAPILEKYRPVLGAYYRLDPAMAAPAQPGVAPDHTSEGPPTGSGSITN